jgi:hypothetical protein
LHRIDLKRLRESIQQLEAGQVETVKLEDLDAQLDEFIENANTHTQSFSHEPRYWHGMGISAFRY